jgi:hypothetical protein
MRLLLFTAALALPAASSAGPAPADSRSAEAAAASREDCPTDPNLHQADTPGPALVHRLGELPPGNLTLTVMREVDGCIEPVIVRYGIGAAAEPAPGDGDESTAAPRIASALRPGGKAARVKRPCCGAISRV